MDTFLYSNVDENQEQVQGTEHLVTAQSLNNLAAFYYHQGEYAQTLPFLRRALTIYEQVLGKDRPHTKFVREIYTQLLGRMKRKQ